MSDKPEDAVHDGFYWYLPTAADPSDFNESEWVVVDVWTVSPGEQWVALCGVEENYRLRDLAGRLVGPLSHPDVGYQEALHRPAFPLKPSTPWPRPDKP